MWQISANADFSGFKKTSGNKSVNNTFAILLALLSISFASTVVSAQQAKRKAASSAQTSAVQKDKDNTKRRALYAQWKTAKTRDRVAAYKIAGKYLEKFSEDASEETESLKKWVDEYESAATVSDSAKNKPTMAGTWDLVISGPQGNLAVKFVLTQEGNAFRGSGEVPVGMLVIKDGAIADDRFSAIAVLDMKGNSLTGKLEGTIEGNSVKGVIKPDTPGLPEFSFVGKRAD
jgi:hypothetical protein